MRERFLLAAVAAVTLFASPSMARAQDTTHGRVDGDVSFVLGLGATIAPRSPRAAADLRVRYLDLLGVFGTYEDALGASSAEPTRAIATGLEVRPLFLGRWLKGMESGAPMLDLTLDSLGLELGAVFQQPKGASFGPRPALQAGLGIEVPIFARAEGLWLDVHGGARFGERAFEAASVTGPLDRALYLQLTLAYHLYVRAHIVDVSDRRVGAPD